MPTKLRYYCDKVPRALTRDQPMRLALVRPLTPTQYQLTSQPDPSTGDPRASEHVEVYIIVCVCEICPPDPRVPQCNCASAHSVNPSSNPGPENQSEDAAIGNFASQTGVYYVTGGNEGRGVRPVEQQKANAQVGDNRFNLFLDGDCKRTVEFL